MNHRHWQKYCIDCLLCSQMLKTNRLLFLTSLRALCLKLCSHNEQWFWFIWFICYGYTAGESALKIVVRSECTRIGGSSHKNNTELLVRGWCWRLARLWAWSYKDFAFLFLTALPLQEVNTSLFLGSVVRECICDHAGFKGTVMLCYFALKQQGNMMVFMCH